MIGKAMRLTTVCTLAFAICGNASRDKVAGVSEGTQSEPAHPQALLEEKQRLETPFAHAARLLRQGIKALEHRAAVGKEYGAKVLKHRDAVGKGAGGLAVGYAGYTAAGHDEAFVRLDGAPPHASERIAKWAERLERESRDAADETLLITLMLTAEFPELREAAALALGEIAKDAKWKHDSPEMTALRMAAHDGNDAAGNALQEIFSTPQNAAGNDAAGNDEDRRLKGLKEQLKPDDEDADLLEDLSSSTSSAAGKEHKDQSPGSKRIAKWAEQLERDAADETLLMMTMLDAEADTDRATAIRLLKKGSAFVAGKEHKDQSLASERIAKLKERLERESRDAADETLLLTTMSDNDEVADLLKDLSSSTLSAADPEYKDEVAALITQLSNPDYPEVREAAAIALGEIGKDAKWPEDSPEVKALNTAADTEKTSISRDAAAAREAVQEILSWGE